MEDLRAVMSQYSSGRVRSPNQLSHRSNSPILNETVDTEGEVNERAQLLSEKKRWAQERKVDELRWAEEMAQLAREKRAWAEEKEEFNRRLQAELTKEREAWEKEKLEMTLRHKKELERIQDHHTEEIQLLSSPEKIRENFPSTLSELQKEHMKLRNEYEKVVNELKFCQAELLELRAGDQAGSEGQEEPILRNGEPSLAREVERLQKDLKITRSALEHERRARQRDQSVMEDLQRMLEKKEEEEDSDQQDDKTWQHERALLERAHVKDMMELKAQHESNRASDYANFKMILAEEQEKLSTLEEAWKGLLAGTHDAQLSYNTQKLSTGKTLLHVTCATVRQIGKGDSASNSIPRRSEEISFTERMNLTGGVRLSANKEPSM
uniref:Uncharacterized protein n=1 Tax=Guillardia theta TaxID=55529 RepID=A0A7S4U8N9_GUITH|mmetsp:Transcript_41696/g.131419  ORF Transcript_41696/g.131419 Transcript_41696/m.131419 type:complete len:381 (+) Transcript_41696:79-1221(+)